MKSKLILFYLFAILFSVSGFSQSITYSAENKEIIDVLEDIENEYDLHFSYSTKLLKNKKTSIDVADAEVDDFLYEILHEFAITHKRTRKGFYILKPLSKTGYTLHAIVLSENSGLAYADVDIVGTYDGTITDANGNFSLEIEDPKNTMLRISYLGYQTQYINAEALYKKGSKSIMLQREIYELKPVSIKEYLNPSITYDERYQVVVMKPRDMQILPGFAEPDLMHSIQVIPGINSNSESASELNIRGSFNDASLVYYDGIPVYNTGQLFGMLSKISLKSISEVEVYKKGIPVEYSEAVSGLINVRSMTDIPEKFSLRFGINLHDVNLHMESPLIKEKTGLSVNIKQSINSFTNSPGFRAHSLKLFNQANLEDTDQTLAVTPPEMEAGYTSISLKGIHKFNNKHRLDIAGYFSRDHLSVYNHLGNPEEDIESLSIGYGGNLGWSARISEKLNLLTSASISGFDTPNHLYLKSKNTESTNLSNNSLTGLETKIRLKYTANKSHTITTGIHGILLQAQYNDEITHNFTQLNDYSEDAIAFSFFIDDNINLNDQFSIYPGLKANYYESVNEFKLLPSFKLRYELFDKLNLSFTAGKYSKQLRSWHYLNPEITEMAQPSFILAQDDLPLLEGYEISAGSWYSFKGLFVDVDFFHKQQTGILLKGYNPEISTDKILSGDMRISGIDVMLRKRFRHYRTWVSYTFSKSENNFEHINSLSFTSFTDRPHQLQWVHSIHMGQFEFSFAYSYKSGTPYSKPSGWIETSENTYQLLWTNLNTERLPSYSRIDASIWYKFPRKKVRKWNGIAGLSLINLYNKRNIWYKQYRVSENEDGIPEITEYDRYLIGISPNLSIRLSF